MAHKGQRCLPTFDYTWWGSEVLQTCKEDGIRREKETLEPRAVSSTGVTQSRLRAPSQQRCQAPGRSSRGSTVQHSK